MTQVQVQQLTPSLRHTLHPFPARMAPEIALEVLSSLPTGSTILDPMCGSGTVLREALRYGHAGIGLDLDPLAVLISRVATHRLETSELLDKAHAITAKATLMLDREVNIPWIDEDEETRRFVEFWFASEQRRALRVLNHVAKISASRPSKRSMGSCVSIFTRMVA